MKKAAYGILSMLVGAIPHLSSAQLPYSNSFESAIDNGASISLSIYSNTWSGTGGIITNGSATNHLNTAYMGTPLGGPHDYVLAFEKSQLTNEVSGPVASVVGIDTMILPTFSPELTTSDALSNSQFGIAFTTNGCLALYHGGYFNSDLDQSGATDYQTWTVFNNGPVVTTGKWVRVTATVNYDARQNGATGNGYVMFKVAIDGIEQTDSTGCSSDDLVATNGGPWFVVAAWEPGLALHRMIINGEGEMDDLVINSEAIPPYVTPTNHIPYAWYVSMGITNLADLTAMSSSQADSLDATDSDLDMMPNWAEYLAGTNPNNSNSKLAIVSEVLSGPNATVRWLSSPGVLGTYRIDSSTNLSNWTTVAANIPFDSSGTNSQPSLPATNNPTFYRVNVNK
ncbi:MAG: hypothetical protein WCO42_03165 [bacterium]